MSENENENVEPVSEGAEGKTSRLKNLSKRGKMTAIIVAAVIVIAGFGFWTWHEQPSFCGAICHTPMDAYADTYFTDVNDEDATLVAVHAAAGKTCLSCHPANLGDQITEGMHWVSGDFTYDKETGKLISRSNEFAAPESCMTSNCHIFSLEDLEKKTSWMEWNPHAFDEHGITNCGDCHKMHDTSVFVCTQCHYQASENVPEGWDALPYRDLTVQQKEM